MSRDESVRVRVVDSNGASSSGASILAYSPFSGISIGRGGPRASGEFTSDASGDCMLDFGMIEGVTPDPLGDHPFAFASDTVWLVARGQGFVSVPKRIGRSTVAREQVVVLKLEESRAAAFCVADAQAHPLVGVVASLYWAGDGRTDQGGWMLEERSDERGVVRFDRSLLGSRGRWALTLWRGDRVTTSLVGTVRKRTLGIPPIVRMRRGQVVVGRAVSSDRRGLADMEMRLGGSVAGSSDADVLDALVRSRTDSDGNFVVSGVPTDGAFLQLERADRLSSMRGVIAVGPGREGVIHALGEVVVSMNEASGLPRLR